MEAVRRQHRTSIPLQARLTVQRRRRRIAPVSPCLLATRRPAMDHPATDRAAPEPVREFLVPRTPPRRLDAAQIAHELGSMPTLLSPLPTTPDKKDEPVSNVSDQHPPDWLDLDTSPIPTTPERAITPSPTRRLHGPRLTREMAPAPPLGPATHPQSLSEQLVQLFGSDSPPSPQPRTDYQLHAAPKNTQHTALLVRVPLEALRPPTCPPSKRFRLRIPGAEGQPPLWLTIPPGQDRRAQRTVLVPASLVQKP